MRTISGSRSGGAQRTAAVVAVAGLASAFSMGTASAEVVPPYAPGISPVANAWYQGSLDRWQPGDTVGTPGVAVNGGSGTFSSAASRADLPDTLVTSSSSTSHNGVGLNRPRPEGYLQDGIYLPEPATVTLSWSMSASTSTTGDNFSSLGMYIAIDCVDGGGFCDANGDGFSTPQSGRRIDLSSNDSRTDVGSLALPLAAGWHKLEGFALADARTVSTGTANAVASLDFAVAVPAGTRWASASGLLPVTGGSEIGEQTPPPPPAPPATPAQLLAELAGSIADAQQDGAIKNARPMLSKVEAAQAALAAGDQRAATSALTDLRNHLRAQSGKHVPAGLATAWSSEAAAVFTQA